MASYWLCDRFHYSFGIKCDNDSTAVSRSIWLDVAGPDLYQGSGDVSDVGIQPNIVQNPDGDKIELLNTAWTIQIVRGFALFAVSLAGAYPFALIYQDQRLFLLISVASFNAVLAGLQSTKLATASRHLDQKGLVCRDLICQVVAAVCMVGTAWWTQSEWALVVGMLVSGVVRLVLSHFWFKGYHNRIGWDPKYARMLIRFGRWVYYEYDTHVPRPAG